MKRALAAVRRVWTAAREVLAEQWEARLVEVPSDPAADATSSADARRVMDKVASLRLIDVDVEHAVVLARRLDELDQAAAREWAAVRRMAGRVEPCQDCTGPCSACGRSS